MANIRTRGNDIIARVAELSGQTDDILAGVTDRRDSMNSAIPIIEAAIAFIQGAGNATQAANELFTTILGEIDGRITQTAQEQAARYTAIRGILSSAITPADFNALIERLRALLPAPQQMPGGQRRDPGVLMPLARPGQRPGPRGGFSYPGSPGRSKRSVRKTHRRKKHAKKSFRK